MIPLRMLNPDCVPEVRSLRPEYAGIVQREFMGLRFVRDDRLPPGAAIVLGPEPSPAARARGVERQRVLIQNIGMADDPLPFIDTEAAMARDSAELAAAYDAAADQVEAAEPTNPAQAAAKDANVATLRRRAREIRARLGL